MIGKKKVQKLIVERLNRMNEQSNSHYLNHQEGVIRGILWVLTGEDPGSGLLYDIREIFKLADIKFKENEDGTLQVDDSYIEEQPDEDDEDSNIYTTTDGKKVKLWAD